MVIRLPGWLRLANGCWSKLLQVLWATKLTKWLPGRLACKWSLAQVVTGLAGSQADQMVTGPHGWQMVAGTNGYKLGGLTC